MSSTLSQELMAEQQAREVGDYRPGGMHRLVERALRLEAERKAFMLEAQRNEAEANRLASELTDTKVQLAYVRQTVRTQEDVARALEDEIAQLCAQREARRA